MLTYDFYTAQYGGTVPQTDFNRLKHEGIALVDFRTFNRLDWSKEDYNAQICVCRLIDTLHAKEAYEAADIVKSETVGQHKVDYALSNKKANYTALADEIIRHHFANTGLMYRGG